MSITLVSNEKIAETSSRGNQEKWLDNGKWYKVDQFGYEALAEVFTSLLLEHSNIEKDTPFTFVRYNMEQVVVHGRQRTACSSPNFLPQNTSIITISQLFKQHLGSSLSSKLTSLSSDKQRMLYLAEATADITGLSLFPQYLTLLFELDSLVLNDDRHLNNIAVLAHDTGFDYCPIFDQGAALLSNTRYCPMEIEPRSLVNNQIARPFNTTFNRQVITMRTQFGNQLCLPTFTKQYLQELVEPLLAYYPARDRSYIMDRVVATICLRQPHLH